MRATGLGKRRPHANPSFKLFTRPALLAHKSARFFQLVRIRFSAKHCRPWCRAGVRPTERFAKKIAEPIQNNFRALYLAHRLGGR